MTIENRAEPKLEQIEFAILETSLILETKPDTPTALSWQQKLQAQLKAWAEPLAVFVSWRFGLGILAFWAATLIPMYASRNGASPYKPVYQEAWYERLLGIWGHWDGEWFMHIANAGYLRDEGSSPFFPLYPLLMQLLAVPFGGDRLLAGVLVSAFASVAAFVLLYELVRYDFGEELAKRSLLYLAAFPTSFFLAAVYSESLFLALMLGAFLAARRYRNWWVVGLLVGLASITRNLGILLLLPLGWEWWRQHRYDLFEREKANPVGWRLNIRWQRLEIVDTLALLGFPAILLGSWLGFQWLALGNPLKFVEVQSMWMWGRKPALPWESVGQSIQLLFRDKPLLGSLSPTPGLREDPNLLDFVIWAFMVLVFAAGVYLGWRKKLPVSYLIFFAMSLVLPLFSPAPEQPIMSFPRFALLIFPAFIVLAWYGLRWRIVHYTYLLAGILMLGLLLARFANWYWVA